MMIEEKTSMAAFEKEWIRQKSWGELALRAAVYFFTKRRKS